MVYAGVCCRWNVWRKFSRACSPVLEADTVSSCVSEKIIIRYGFSLSLGLGAWRVATNDWLVRTDR